MQPSTTPLGSIPLWLKILQLKGKRKHSNATSTIVKVATAQEVLPMDSNWIRNCPCEQHDFSLTRYKWLRDRPTF